TGSSVWSTGEPISLLFTSIPPPEPEARRPTMTDVLGPTFCLATGFFTSGFCYTPSALLPRCNWVETPTARLVGDVRINFVFIPVAETIQDHWLWEPWVRLHPPPQRGFTFQIQPR